MLAVTYSCSCTRREGRDADLTAVAAARTGPWKHHITHQNSLLLLLNLQGMDHLACWWKGRQGAGALHSQPQWSTRRLAAVVGRSDTTQQGQVPVSYRCPLIRSLYNTYLGHTQVASPGLDRLGGAVRRR
jgi:hypothetical protein